MANDYTSSTDAFAEMPEGNFSSSDYLNMASYVTAASRLIDAEFGRWAGFFSPTTDTQTFYYNGNNDECLPIDEFVSISAVAVAEQGGISSSDYTSWTENTDYVTAPYNASNKSKPINQLELVEYAGTKAAWYRGQKSVKVTGIPGYSATVPDLIAQATKIQAVRWFMRAKGGWQDTTGNESVGQARYKGMAELDADIKLMLHPLRLELS